MTLPGFPFKLSIKRQKTRVSEHAHYGLTPLGKVKVGEHKLVGTNGAVLEAIEDGNDMVSEICDETRMTPEKVKWILKKLIREGYVQQLRGD